MRVETLELDLPALVAAFGRRLHEAGVPVTAERSARFADALALVRPVSRRRLYWTARAALVSERAQAAAFDAVFASVFGSRIETPAEPPPANERRAPAPPDARAAVGRRDAAEPAAASIGHAGDAP